MKHHRSSMRYSTTQYGLLYTFHVNLKIVFNHKQLIIEQKQYAQ